ncbi:MAG: zinc ribbon domain-containing protein [Deltaproteobacteria bacterium]|nr:zinc ribbon domain-containing protein [Deltaproteobacteria bacterium]
MLWAGGLAAGGVVMFLFLRVAANARLDGATTSLVLTAFALVLCLYSLYRLVQALAKPSLELAVEVEGELGLASDRALREEKRRLLRAINELRFDHEMGKLSQADYERVRDTYTLQAVEVMRQLEGEPALHPALAEQLGVAAKRVAQSEISTVQVARDELEAAAADPAALPTPAVATAPAAEASPAIADTPEPEPAADEAVAGVDARACAACEGRNDVDAKFCKHCGKELAA